MDCNTPATTMNPLVGRRTVEPASTTRVAPRGCRDMSSAVIFRCVTSDATDGRLVEGGDASASASASARACASPAAETRFASPSPFPAPVGFELASFSSFSSRFSSLSSSSASARAASSSRRSASLAADASSAVAADDTTAVPTQCSPTNTATVAGSSPAAGARTRSRTRSPSATSTVVRLAAPARETSIVSSRVHT